MTEEPLARIATLLGTVGGRTAFSAKRAADPADLHIEVGGVGPLQIPVSARQARQLVGVARPARYGQGEQTLVDARVRDTWQVPKSRVRIDQRRWNRTLLPMLDTLRADLGLPAGCRLRAELHAVLVYTPGQFFVPHQDSEKSDAMVGTLTVTLPGQSRGGALIIEHGGTRKTYRSSETALSLVAFYADCRHEVRPVRSGYRVVLTYNLMLVGDTAASAAAHTEPDVAAELGVCLLEHFTDQRRLVYLLDHDYTARGLDWARLKGVDATRAAALLAAARATDCEMVLALAELQETWSCDEPDGYPGGRGSWYDEDEPEELDPGSYQLEELLDSSTTLDAWVDRNGQPARPVVSQVRDDEVCATTPTASLTPYESDYEGYMGNYGNTMDRWYRRGALVMWPRRLDFAVRAEASPTWALETLADLVRSGDIPRARDGAESLSSFWGDAIGIRPATAESERATLAHRRDLDEALIVADGLDDPALAAMLLAPFHTELLATEHADALSAVGRRYGRPWMRALLESWAPRTGGWYGDQAERRTWMASLPGLCDALGRSGDTDIAGLLLADSWAWLTGAVDRALASDRPSHRTESLAALSAPIAGLLIGATIAGDGRLSDAAVGFLRSRDDAILGCLVGSLRKMSEGVPDAPIPPGFDALARHCIGRLDARLIRPPRDPDDWSIDAPLGCTCALCTQLATFLGDPAGLRIDWPLAEQRRRHVHERIDRCELPVRHQTRRSGRPYTLVLTKTSALFEREAQARSEEEADLGWLREAITGRAGTG